MSRKSGRYEAMGLSQSSLLSATSKPNRRGRERLRRRTEDEPGLGRDGQPSGRVAFAESFEEDDPAVLDDPHGRARDVPLLEGCAHECPDRGGRLGG